MPAPKRKLDNPRSTGNVRKKYKDDQDVAPAPPRGTSYLNDSVDQGISEAHNQVNNVVDRQCIKRPSLQQAGLPLPNMWAESRQELCETLPWFRSYQGGVYFTGGVAKGYLLSAYSACRDVFHDKGRLIISHGGGKSESIHTREGVQITQGADDQLEEDTSVRALMNSYLQNRPLGLIVDDKYPIFPYDLTESGVGYAVLGLYYIVHAWAERQPSISGGQDVVRFKFAFRWCDQQGPPWWDRYNVGVAIPPPVSHTEALDPQTPDEDPSGLRESRVDQMIGGTSIQCASCLKASPKVYTAGWTCLNPVCGRFWNIFSAAPSQQLEYNADFLLSTPKASSHVFVLEPALPYSNDDSTDYSHSRGFHCRKCGRLSCRFKWEQWECSSCEDTVKVPAVLQTREDLKRALEKAYEIFDGEEIKFLRTWRINHDRGFTLCRSFRLARGGAIVQLQYKPMRMESEPDVIFREYQEQSNDGTLPLRRYPLKTHKCNRGLSRILRPKSSHPGLIDSERENACKLFLAELLGGEPYNYVANTDSTIPFGCDRTPGAVAKARDFIENRVSQVLGRKVEFNEVLSAAYMEKQKMSFHSDSEKGLGPLVASLSLGSPAHMHFRVRSRRSKEAAGGKTNARTAVTFSLCHGDILLMEGHEVQHEYEHTVIPTKFRIAATARFIQPSQNLARGR